MINRKKFFQSLIIGGLVLITVILGRVELLKNAKASLGPGIYGCGIRINPESEELPSAANGWTYSMSYRIFNVDNPDGWWKFEFWKCLCPEGEGQVGGNCLNCETSQETIPLKQVASAARDSGNDVNAVVRRFSLVQPGGGYCGSFQFDAYIIDGTVRGCVDFQGGRYGHAWSLFRTGIDCGGQPTPTPTCPTATPTLTPTPTTQLTCTPTPTPTTSEKNACYTECGSDGDCTGSLKCQEVNGVKRCVNIDCSSESDCTCNRGCWNICGHPSECNGGQDCRQIGNVKRCVLNSSPSVCDTEAGCCAQSTPQVLGAQVLPGAGFESFSGTSLVILGLAGAFLRLVVLLI